MQRIITLALVFAVNVALATLCPITLNPYVGKRCDYDAMVKGTAKTAIVYCLVSNYFPLTCEVLENGWRWKDATFTNRNNRCMIADWRDVETFPAMWCKSEQGGVMLLCPTHYSYDVIVVRE